MGYTTEFEGKFDLNKKLDEETYEILVKLANTRRMKRDVNKLKEMGYEGNYGVEGEFFFDGTGFFGQEWDESVIDSNQPPKTQPSLWCKWIPTEDGMSIEWDGAEKFYDYTDWIKYIISKILEPKGYVLNGKVLGQGENISDRFFITIVNNKVTKRQVLNI